jgi:uncharacterized membrane protein
VSDIGLGDGLGVFFGICLTFAIGGVGLVLALVAALALRPASGERRGRRVLRFIAGPAACLLVGALSTITLAIAQPTAGETLAAGGRTALSVLDDLWFLYPMAGAVIGAVVSFAVALRHRS